MNVTKAIDLQKTVAVPESAPNVETGQVKYLLVNYRLPDLLVLGSHHPQQAYSSQIINIIFS